MTSDIALRATRSSWAICPPPVLREALGFAGEFTAPEAEQLLFGFVPQAMEDKWFIYHENGELFFHRSWKGALIYRLLIEPMPDGGARVLDSWVNRDPAEYRGTDIDYDRKLLRFIIDTLLLKKSGTPFPMPENVVNSPEGLVQHVYAGRPR